MAGDDADRPKGTLEPPRLWEDAGWPDPHSERPAHILFYRNLHRDARPDPWDPNCEPGFQKRYARALWDEPAEPAAAEPSCMPSLRRLRLRRRPDAWRDRHAGLPWPPEP